MDDQDRTADQNPGDANNMPPTEHRIEGDAVPIPDKIREAVDEVRRRAKEEATRGRDIVREYEERYYGRRADRLEAVPEDGTVPPAESFRFKPKRGVMTDANVNERKWAALAHGSTLLTALVALASGGAGVLLTMLVPLFIYFSFRKRSEFVAFHALQAFTIQLVGTIGFLALIIVGTIVWAALLVISALLILVLVGIVLVLLVALMYPVFILASLALPIGMVIYSVIATFETWHGRDYRFPYIARWIDGQMHYSYS
jgi:uncharacterized Tic20 family protein